MSTQPKTFLTPEQYLEIERKAEFKSEYYKGEMFAMSGAGLTHNLLASRLNAILRGQLAAGCEAMGSDMRVHIPSTGLYTYPDLVVYCGKPELQDTHLDTLLNPTVIVEVLSPSTEAYDRGRKFEHFKSIQSLQQYLLLATDRIHADLFTRQSSGAWLLTSATGMEGVLQLQSIGCTLALRDLYERLELNA